MTTVAVQSRVPAFPSLLGNTSSPGTVAQSSSGSGRRLSDLLLVHIPKTAGASLFAQLASVFDVHGNSVSSETCLPPYREGNKPRVVLLRSPRAHVVSQYLECRHSDWGLYTQRKFAGKKGFRDRYVVGKSDVEGLTAWADHFVAHAWPPNADPTAIDFLCYDPRDMQTRALTCQSNRTFANHHVAASEVAGWHPNATEAMRNALQPGVILGLSELYRASVCLVHYHLQKRLAPGCACTDVAINRSFMLEHETHGIPHLDVDALPPPLQLRIDRLTLVDQVVYVRLAQKVPNPNPNPNPNPDPNPNPNPNLTLTT